jgi:hypothetical protein
LEQENLDPSFSKAAKRTGARRKESFMIDEKSRFWCEEGNV